MPFDCSERAGAGEVNPVSHPEQKWHAAPRRATLAGSVDRFKPAFNLPEQPDAVVITGTEFQDFADVCSRFFQTLLFVQREREVAPRVAIIGPQLYRVITDSDGFVEATLKNQALTKFRVSGPVVRANRNGRRKAAPAAPCCCCDNNACLSLKCVLARCGFRSIALRNAASASADRSARRNPIPSEQCTFVATVELQCVAERPHGLVFAIELQLEFRFIDKSSDTGLFPGNF